VVDDHGMQDVGFCGIKGKSLGYPYMALGLLIQ